MSSLRSHIVCETRCIDRKVSFTWKIIDYASYLEEKKVLFSDFFLFENTRFRLVADLKENSAVSCFRVNLLTCDAKKTFQYLLSVKDSDNKNKFQKKGNIKRGKASEKLRVSEDKVSALVVHNCLTIVCNIVFYDTICSNYVLPSQGPVSYSRLNELWNDLEQLLSKEDHSDIIITVENETIPAHSTILAIRSPRFLQDMQGSHEINITEFRASVINYFLRYLYTGTLEELKELPDDLLTELYTAADKYEVNGLKEMCTEKIAKNLSEDNAESYAVLAFTHDEQMLRNAVAEFFARNNKLIKSDMWKRLEKECPTLAILVLSNVKKIMT